MKINTNTWNKIRYTLYTPGYDSIAKYFDNSRKLSIASLAIKQNDKILIIGAGTGLDLDYLPDNCEIYATDITQAMINRVIKRNFQLKLDVKALVMDGQALQFEDNTFDFIMLHLILAVIPDPIACIKEAERVLKSGGEIAIFDKFIPNNKDISLKRKIVNIFSNIIATDITHSFESIISNTDLYIVSDLKADFNGNFRLIKLKKK